MERPQTVSISARLADTPARNRTFWIPDLVSDVVDDLVERSTANGYPTKRADVVAGLIVAAHALPADDIELSVRAYLRAEVGSVAGDREEAGLVRLRTPTPGPRPTSVR